MTRIMLDAVRLILPKVTDEGSGDEQEVGVNNWSPPQLKVESELFGEHSEGDW